MVVPAACALGLHQRIHEAQIGEGIPAIDHLTLVNRAAVTMHKAGREGRTAEDHGNGNPRRVERLEVVFHEGG